MRSKYGSGSRNHKGLYKAIDNGSIAKDDLFQLEVECANCNTHHAMTKGYPKPDTSVKGSRYLKEVR